MKNVKFTDIFVCVLCTIGCIAIVYFGICYFNILCHNLDPNGYDYPSWNILANAIEETR